MQHRKEAGDRILNTGDAIFLKGSTVIKTVSLMLGILIPIIGFFATFAATKQKTEDSIKSIETSVSEISSEFKESNKLLIKLDKDLSVHIADSDSHGGGSEGNSLGGR